MQRAFIVTIDFGASAPTPAQLDAIATDIDGDLSVNFDVISVTHWGDGQAPPNLMDPGALGGELTKALAQAAANRRLF